MPGRRSKRHYEGDVERCGVSQIESAAKTYDTRLLFILRGAGDEGDIGAHLPHASQVRFAVLDFKEQLVQSGNAAGSRGMDFLSSWITKLSSIEP